MAGSREPGLWRYLQSQRRLAARLIEETTLAAVAPDFLEEVAGLLRSQAGALWEVPSEGEVLDFVADWSQPGLAVEPLWRRSRELRIHRGEALPGRAWADGQIAVAPDFSSCGHHPRGEQAATLGLEAALAVPIPIGDPDEVRAVAEFDAAAFRIRSEELMAALAVLSDQLATFIRHRRTVAEAAAGEQARQHLAEVSGAAAMR